MRGSVSVALVYWYFDNSSSSSGSNSDDAKGEAPLSVLDRRHATLIVSTCIQFVIWIFKEVADQEKKEHGTRDIKSSPLKQKL